MTTSDRGAGGAAAAFVWVWLPGASEPVVAGRLDNVADSCVFTYGRSYLARDEAIALYLPELPLRGGRIAPVGALAIAGCLRDAGPDAWGQRVILARRLGHLDATAGVRATGQHPAVMLTRPLDETMPARPSAKHDKDAVHAALQSNDWNIAAAQRALGIPNRTTLVRLMEKFGLERPD